MPRLADSTSASPLSPDGTIWEGSRSNLFVVSDGQLLTPPASGRILPGIMRGLILERAERLDWTSGRLP